jgi:hypothetical protein
VTRSYSLPTVKTLFAEANACAYPDCSTALIFRDRGRTTVVAQIAHIRSESRLGPRYDESFDGALNGPENLLLLCGVHHPPVDRHESLYGVEELLQWKADQIRRAGGGTAVSEEQVRALVGLSGEERQALTMVARLAQRVITVCQEAHEAVTDLYALEEASRSRAAMQFGSAYSVKDDGTRERIDPRTIPLSGVEQQEWAQKRTAELDARDRRVRDALGALEEELAVFKMMSPNIAGSTETVLTAAVGVLRTVTDPDPERIAEARRAVEDRLAQLWRVANGDEESSPYLSG